MPMPPELRERVRGWGKRSGVVLILSDERVIGTLRVINAGHDIVYMLRDRHGEYDDLWFKVFPIDELLEREAEYRAKYGLDRRITKN